jgi:recombination protein RecA
MGIIGDQLSKSSATPAPVAPVVTPQSRSKTQRFKEIAALSKEMDKKHETTSSFVRLGSKVGLRLPCISTGLPTLDEFVLQCGGIPKGRIVELFGPNSAGKSTLALHIVAECQRTGGLAAYVDAEQTLDLNYAANVLSVNVDDLVVNQPNSGEEALQNVSALVDSRAVDIVVVDSVSALVPQAELQGDIGSQFMGLQARMMSQAMRVLVGKASATGTTIIFINQIREKIGVMFGSPETTSGGRALGFAASVRLDIRRIYKALMDGDRLIGHQLKIKAVKNKCGVPFRETLVSLMYDSGLDKEGDLIDFSIKHNVIEKAGASYSFGGERIAVGLDKTKQVLRTEHALLAKVQTALTAALAAENTKADAKE